MAPIKHAVLSASAAHRWLKCTPSAMLTKDIPDEISVYAEEGTAAHEIAEYKVRCYLGEKGLKMPSGGSFDADEIDEYTDVYLQYFIDTYEEIKKSCPDAEVMVEQRLDFSDYVEGGFGTGDLVIIADDVLQIIDLKYGKGVSVSAENNPQMMLYALGAINLYGFLYDIKRVKMSIVQPRLDNISEFEMNIEELISWAENTLKPKAELAAKGEGEMVSGEHCRFCKLKATCRKRMEYNMELAKYDFEMPINLLDTEIALILGRADQFTNWINDIKEFALKEALRGVKYEGLKLVEGRSNRKYVNDEAVAKAVKKLGLDPYKKPKILGISAMEKLLGKKQFNNLLSKYVEKPQGI